MTVQNRIERAIQRAGPVSGQLLGFGLLIVCGQQEDSVGLNYPSNILKGY